MSTRPRTRSPAGARWPTSAWTSWSAKRWCCGCAASHDGQVYDWDLLEESGPIPEALPPIVIIDTGWARWFGEDRRTRHPALAPHAARELLRRGMHVLAVDTLSPDPTGGEGFPVHEAVLGTDRLIVENLRGLDELPKRVRVGFFPLRLGGDGAPVRAVAFLPARSPAIDGGTLVSE